MTDTTKTEKQQTQVSREDWFAFVWSHLHLGFRGSVCALAGVHYLNSSREWEEIDAEQRNRLLGLLREMAAKRVDARSRSINN